MSIRIKLSIIFLAIALVPTIIVGALTFTNYRNSLEANRLASLRDITAFKADKIESYFNNLSHALQVAESSYAIKKNISALNNAEPGKASFITAKEEIDAGIAPQVQRIFGLSAVILTDKQGRIVYTSDWTRFEASFLKQLPDPGQKVFEQGRQHLYLSDLFFDPSRNNEPSMMFSTPVSDFNGVSEGVLVFEIDMKPVYKLIHDNTGLGNTGETLIGKKTGNELVYLNPLKYDPNAALSKKIAIGSKIATPIQNAVIDKAGAGRAVDYRGEKVIGAWQYLPMLGWGLATKMDISEAYADVWQLQKLLLMILGCIFISAAILAFYTAKSLAEPIKSLSKGAEIVGSGNLAHRVGTNSQDEIGQLSRTFDKMTADLRATMASRDELNREINQRKYAQEQAQLVANRFELLAETASKLLQSKNPQQLVNKLCGKVMKSLGCDIFFNYIVDESKQCLHLNAYAGIPENTAKSIEWLEFGTAICGCAQLGERIIAENIPETKDPRTELVSSFGIKAYACHPLMSQGKVIGTLSFGTSCKTAFSNKELATMKAVTDQVATAMERLRAENALLSAHGELEHRVEERTSQLTDAVKTLQTAEQALTAERKRFEDVLEMMPAYAALLTPDYHVAYANKTFRKWFGDDNGRKCYEFLFDRTEPCENCDTYTVLKTGKSKIWEWTGPNGRNYDIYDYPFTDTDGSPLIMEIGMDVTAHKQAQKAVQTSEERYRHLTVATTQVVWSTAANGEVTADMPSWRAFTGQSEEQIKGSGWIDSLHPDDRQRTAEVWSQAVENRSLYQTEYRLKRNDGEYRYVSVRGVPVLEVDGSIREWVGTCTDITERKKMEDELREASLYTRSLLEASLDPLVTISPDGKITDVNRATEMATGIVREELIGSDFSNYFTEPQKAEEGYRKVISEGAVIDYPLTIRNIDGSTMDVLYNATVYKDENGRIQGVFAAARDITEKKLVETKQLVTNSLLELFIKTESRKEYLDSTVAVLRNWSGCEFVGIRVRDKQGNIPYESHIGFSDDFLSLENALHLDSDKCVCIRAILENPQAQERGWMSGGGAFYCNDSQSFLNGLSEDQLTQYRGNCIRFGFQSIAVIPIRYRDQIYGAVHIADFKKDMVRLCKIGFIETIIIPLIGEAINRFDAETELEDYRLNLENLVKQRTSELEQSNGRLENEVAFRKQIAEELERSNKDLEQFAYVASHDLQEPLRAVTGFVQLLRQELDNKLTDTTSEYMTFVIEGVSRMQSLISGLLQYSRIGHHGQIRSIDARGALDRALAHLQVSIQETNTKITFDDLPMVRMDSVQLSQLFQNLVGNAIKFRSNGNPEIHIGAVRQDSSWRFSVADNGIGIEPQYAEKIFLIFQRLHTRDKYPGTGIGLAICKKIIERHGGTIWVESAIGRGSTFYFTVPDKGEV